MLKKQEMLDQQFKRWELDHEVLERFARDEKIQRPSQPVITVSRELGSGGMFTGRLVANMLKFAYYDKEILEQIAEETGSSEKHIAGHEQAPPDFISGILLQLLDQRNVSDTVYLRSLVRVLRRISAEGRAVIMGRGAAFALRHSLKVRVVAPLDVRIRRISDIRKLTLREAERAVLESDYGQQRFLRTFFGARPNDVLAYDLIINTEHCDLQHAADLIVTRMRQIWKEGE